MKKNSELTARELLDNISGHIGLNVESSTVKINMYQVS